MKWSTFITSVAALYGLWYACNLIRDLFFSKRIASGSEFTTVYDVSDLLQNDEDSATTVDEKHFNLPSNDQQFTVKSANQHTAEPTQVELKQPPQGQGLKLHEFLEQAKKKAALSAQNIEFAQ